MSSCEICSSVAICCSKSARNHKLEKRKQASGLSNDLQRVLEPKLTMFRMPVARGTAKLVVILCIASIASGLRSVGPYLKRTVTLMKSNIDDVNHARTDIVPTSSVSNNKGWTVQAFKSLTAFSVAAIPLLTATKAKAVGELFEFKELNMVIQDISFNVGNTLQDSEALATLFQNNIRPLRTRNEDGLNVTVLAFGPDAFARSVHVGGSKLYLVFNEIIYSFDLCNATQSTIIHTWNKHILRRRWSCHYHFKSKESSEGF